jgi:hypothetical protein
MKVHSYTCSRPPTRPKPVKATISNNNSNKSNSNSNSQIRHALGSSNWQQQQQQLTGMDHGARILVEPAVWLFQGQQLENNYPRLPKLAYHLQTDFLVTDKRRLEQYAAFLMNMVVEGMQETILETERPRDDSKKGPFTYLRMCIRTYRNPKTY